MVMWPLVLMTGLCVVLGWGIYQTVVQTRKPKQSRLSIYEDPKSPADHGRRDMLAGVCGIMYGDAQGRRVLSLVAATESDPIGFIAKKLSSQPVYLKEYSKFSQNSGRTNRTYMTASNGVDFEKYVVGGRELIDDLDRELQKIRIQEEIVEARKDALADSDNHHNLTRKELRKLQGGRDKEELKSFDDQMKEIENGTQND